MNPLHAPQHVPSLEGQGVAVDEYLRAPDGAAVKDPRGGQGDLGSRRSAHSGLIEPGDSSEIRRYPAAVTEHKAPVPADKADATAEVVKLVAKSPAEVSQGAGLGRVLSMEEGQARLAAYAKPERVED